MDPGQQNRVELAISHKAKIRKQIYIVFMVVFILIGDKNPGIDWIVNISGTRAWVSILLLLSYLWVMWFSYRSVPEGELLLVKNPYAQRWIGLGTLVWVLWHYIKTPITKEYDPNDDSRRAKKRDFRNRAQNDLAFFMNNSFPEWVLIAGSLVSAWQLFYAKSAM